MRPGAIAWYHGKDPERYPNLKRIEYDTECLGGPESSCAVRLMASFRFNDRIIPVYLHRFGGAPAPGDTVVSS
jgi:hypothetical protein